MNNYQDTNTWKKMLANQNEHKEVCEWLKVEFEKFRDSAKILAGEVAKELPDYTVHDVTHIDALWDMADVFLPNAYDITPIECFVLGGAFILHDLGMAIAAYPEGVKGIQKENIWKDTVANLCKKQGLSYNFDELDSIDKDINKIAIQKTLRTLHARKANDLAKMSWKDSNGNDIYLIDDKRLRDAYGTIIGQIAQSHWLDCKDLPEEFPVVLGALSNFPEAWTVDPLKLACIVRIADAMHIDDRRAPSLLKAIKNIDKDSELYWLFQEKLYKPRVENNRMVYTSKSAFELKEINAWWLCYDTLKMIDEELQNVDALLLENNRKSFGVIGVCGIDNLEQIQKMITVEKWKPIDTSIKVNNVAKLVSTLGGAQLYGDNNQVPLRELIQNAADAIRARRYFDEEPDTFGDINLSWGEENGEEYIQVEDNGIGMSQNVLVNVLLDFGQSFWGTERMHDEFPGLEQKPFKSTGKFGIGFFSVFMWGEKVKVISNRCDKGRDSTTVLEFVKGLNTRPILRRANSDEIIKNGGTRIKVWLSKKRVVDIFKPDFRMTLSLKEMIARMCFALDCNLYINNENKELLVKANDWYTLSTEDFISRLFGKKGVDKLKKTNPYVYKILSENIRIIKEDDGYIVGRACMFDEQYRHGVGVSEGIVTVDGIRTSTLRGIIGVMKGETERASRDIAIPIVSQATLDNWVEEQAQLIVAARCSEESQLEHSSLGYTLSSKTTDLKIAQWKDNYVNYKEIVEIVKKNKYDRYYIVQDAALHNYERERKQKVTLYDNVFICAMGRPSILQTNSPYQLAMWPSRYWKRDDGFSCAVIEEQIVNAFSEAWECPRESILEKVQVSTDDINYKEVIGNIGDEEITMRVDIINAFV